MVADETAGLVHFLSVFDFEPIDGQDKKVREMMHVIYFLLLSCLLSGFCSRWNLTVWCIDAIIEELERQPVRHQDLVVTPREEIRF